VIRAVKRVKHRAKSFELVNRNKGIEEVTKKGTNSTTTPTCKLKKKKVKKRETLTMFYSSFPRQT
jgi:hypothetical protein